MVILPKQQKGSFNLAALTAMCPVSQWDTVFASQVDSVITILWLILYQTKRLQYLLVKHG